MPGITQGTQEGLKSPKRKSHTSNETSPRKRTRKQSIKQDGKIKLEEQKDSDQDINCIAPSNKMDPLRSDSEANSKSEKDSEIQDRNCDSAKENCQGIEFVCLNFPTDSGEVPWKKSGHKTLRAGQFERMKLANYSVEIPCKKLTMFPSISATGTTWWPPQSVV